MEQLFLNIVEYMSVGYVLSVVMFSYIAIAIAGYVTSRTIKTVAKKVITFVIGVVIGIIYYKYDMIELQAILPSFCLSIIGYDYFLKSVIDRIPLLQYKK